MKGFRPDLTPTDPGTRLTGHRAYDELRRQILNAEIPQGAVVNEIAVSESLGMSRTPVREAFRELLNEGLLEGGGPRRQVTVRTVDPEQAEEICRARGALEGISLSSSLGEMNPDRLDELRLVVDRMARALRRDDLQAFLDADDDFHALLSSAARMPTIEELLARLRALSRLAASPGTTSKGAELLRVHTRVIELLARQRGQRARPATALLARCMELVTTA